MAIRTNSLHGLAARGGLTIEKAARWYARPVQGVGGGLTTKHEVDREREAQGGYPELQGWSVHWN
jgi:hypothetical protein